MSHGDPTFGVVLISVPDDREVSLGLLFIRYGVGRNNGITSLGRCYHAALTFCRSFTDERSSWLGKGLVWETNVLVLFTILTITLKSHFPIFTSLLWSCSQYRDFPKAAHDLFCALSWNSLNSLYRFSAMQLRRCCHADLTFCRYFTNERPSWLNKALIWETNVYIFLPCSLKP